MNRAIYTNLHSESRARSRMYVALLSTRKGCVLHYVKKSLMECRKIKADLEERCRTCDRRDTKSCLRCHVINLRRDVELCIMRIESSREYALARDMVRYI